MWVAGMMALLVTCWICVAATSLLPPSGEVVSVTSSATNSILRQPTSPECDVVLLSDSDSSPSSLSKIVRELKATAGVGVFEVREDDHHTNTTHMQLAWVVNHIRQIRQRSWCLTVEVLSNRPSFLSAFAKQSLEGRLLVWETRLLIVTQLALPELVHLMSSHWSFTMMNTMFLNLEGETPTRFGVYVHLPYSQSGAQVLRLAIWTPASGFTLISGLDLFPDKFSNFYEAKVNITALPFPPYWIEEEASHGGGTLYFGTDYLMLKAISEALNFTINVLPTTDWDEVTHSVEERVSFMATVIYAVLPSRLEHYDFSYTYEYASPAFCMSKPVLKPRFLSLYYPLADGVWVSILAVLVLVPTVIIMMSQFPIEGMEGSKINTQLVIQEVVRTLLGQNLTKHMPRRGWTKIVLGTWLVFAFIIGTAYRGNLTASLTIPKYPARPETLQELVNVVKKVTMPPYGAQFRDFYSKSDSTVFKALAQRMDLVPTVLDGLRQVSNKQAHIQVRRYLELVIAEQFTLEDGNTNLYLGQESIFPGLSAWPLPHDAPYKYGLDRYIMAITEAGLYEKWSEDVMIRARKESHKRQQKEKESQGDDAKTGSVTTTAAMQALTITHLQGPLLLLLLGLGFAGLTFTTEVLIAWCIRPKGTEKVITELSHQIMTNKLLYS